MRWLVSFGVEMPQPVFAMFHCGWVVFVVVGVFFNHLGMLRRVY